MKTLLYYIIPTIVIIAIFYLYRWTINRKRLQNFDYSAEGKNIALSITKCKSLHKQLVKAIHPDRFAEAEREIADSLMQKINASKYDYNQLINLKIEVEIFLNKKL